MFTQQCNFSYGQWVNPMNEGCMKAGQSRAGPVYQINTSVACTAIALHRPSTNQQFVPGRQPCPGRDRSRSSDTAGQSFSILHCRPSPGRHS